MSGAIPAIVALPHLDPAFLDSLTDIERLVLPYMRDLWLRPEQYPPGHDWRYYGHICGRGWGKSLTIATEINRRVEAGEARHLALMAPTDDRVEEIQIAFLIATAPPWFMPRRYKGGIIWPNGVEAVTFTPEAPGRSRSENIEVTWLSEIVDWQAATRLDAFQNITTATRVGASQVFWDTTSKGKNEVIQHLMALNAEDPRMYPIARGTTFDNPLLSEKYLYSVCKTYVGARYDEEILGAVFEESAGALFKQKWISDHRVLVSPGGCDLRLVGLDPALSDHKSADEVGIVVAARKAGHVYVEKDLSERLKPEAWGDIAVSECLDNGAAGCIIERNHLGDNATFVLRARAKDRGAQVRVLGTTKGRADPFPAYTPGVIYVREVVSGNGKTVRASGPAAETQAGRVHHVGTHPKLEFELCTYEQGTKRSPNRYDAVCMLINELAELTEEAPPDHTGEARAAAAIYSKLQAGKFLVKGRGRLGL